MTDLKYDAIVFDFDGVLVESNAVKDRAFYKIYEKHGPSIAQAALNFHLQNRGVHRTGKFSHCHRTLLHHELTASELSALSQEFTNLVEEEVVQAPLVSGVQEFLEKFSKKIPLYVASATPVEELKRIIQRKQLNTYFKEVFGYPTTKVQALEYVAKVEELKKSAVLMVGDALTDWEAAQRAETAFIGRICLQDSSSTQSPFPMGTPCIHDFFELESAIT